MGAQLTTLMDMDPTSPVVLAFTGLLGLVMCLSGHKLARPVVTVCGLVLGGVVVFAMPKEPMDRTTLVLWMAGGCLGGVVVTFVLFRIMTGLAFAVFLMVLLPWVALTASNQLPSFDTPAPESLIINIATADDDAGAESDGDIDDTQAAAALSLDHRVRQTLQHLISTQKEPAVQWWQELDRTGQYTVTFCMGAGLLFGLIVGIIGPYFTASILFAFAGASIFLISATAADIQPLNAHLPQQTMGQLAIVCLITIVGVAIQWTVFSRKTDKS